MEENQDHNLVKRIAFLEKELSEIKNILSNKQQSKPTAKIIEQPPTPPRPTPPPPPPPSQQQIVKPVTSKIHIEPSPSFQIPEHMKSGEYWLNKIGIGLVIFSVLFFFKYSIDQGWLVPKIRIAIGLALGLTLQVFAFYLYKNRRHFSLVLFGGGIAVFYICGFASFQLFELVSHFTALLFMIAITIYSITISLKQNEQILSLVGSLGGLATPFLLYTGQGNIPGLMMYLSVLLSGISVIYFFKSWRGLLWTNYIIGMGIIVSVASEMGDLKFKYTDAQRWSVQYTLILAWLAFAIVPLLREIYAQLKPEKFKYIKFNYLKKLLSEQFEQTVVKHAHILFVSTPVIVFSFSMYLWDEKLTSQEFWGWIAMSLAMLYGIISYHLTRWKSLKNISIIHLMVGILALTISFLLLFESETLISILGAEAFILFYIGHKLSEKKFLRSGYVLFTGLFFAIAVRTLWEKQTGTPFFNIQSLADFWVILLAITVSYLSKDKAVVRYFYITGSMLLTTLLVREFDNNLLFILTASITLGNHYAHHLKSDKILRIFSHIYTAGVSLWLIDRLMLTQIADFPISIGSRPIFNYTSLADIVFLVILIFISRKFISDILEKSAYYLWSHGIILAIFLREFQSLENGQGYVTVAWGLYAALLLIFGLRLDKVNLRKIAITTLLLVVGKLFLVDLANLETIWRILLFLGFGGVFLLLSYYFKSLWKESEDSNKSL